MEAEEAGPEAEAGAGEREAKRARYAELRAELDSEFDADGVPMPLDRRRELYAQCLALAHADGRCAAQEGSLAARRAFAEQTDVLLQLARPRMVPQCRALLAAAGLAVEDVCHHERHESHPSSSAALASAPVPADANADANAVAGAVPVAVPLPHPEEPMEEPPPFLETLAAAVRGSPDSLKRLRVLARAHRGAWLAFVAATMPACHRSPRACAAVSFASRGAPWAALPLPRAARDAAAVLAAGEPHMPSCAAQHPHRRAEAAAALVAPLRALAPRLPRAAWAVLTGCFHPWLVFAAAALVAAARAREDSPECRDALVWLASFWFVCPRDTSPRAADAFGAALRRFVADVAARCTTHDAVTAELRAIATTPSVLPRYLRMLCVSHCEPPQTRTLLGFPSVPQ